MPNNKANRLSQDFHGDRTHTYQGPIQVSRKADGNELKTKQALKYQEGGHLNVALRLASGDGRVKEHTLAYTEEKMACPSGR